MLYMGVGGSWSPHCPLIDILLGQRLQARGFAGSRDETVCNYGSTLKEQALDYARDGQIEYLKVLDPMPGAVISWAPGIRDFLLAFQDHVSDMHYVGMRQFAGVRFGPLMADIRGDIDLMETYLRQGRQKKAVGAIIDNFLHHHTVREHVFQNGDDLPDILEDHEGEVWITGPCRILAFDPDLHEAPSPRAHASPRRA